VLGGSGSVSEVAPAEAAGVITFETENVALAGKTGALGPAGKLTPGTALLSHAESSNVAHPITLTNLKKRIT